MSNRLLINQKYVEIQCDKNDWETHNLVNRIPYVHAIGQRQNSELLIVISHLSKNYLEVLIESNVDTLPPKA